jgi:hypothetical protein
LQYVIVQHTNLGHRKAEGLPEVSSSTRALRSGKIAVLLLVTVILLDMSSSVPVVGEEEIHRDPHASIDASTTTGTLVFHVMDALNRTGIEGANITQSYAPPGYPRLSVKTGSLGYATLQYLDAGSWYFAVSADGYQTQEVMANVAPDEPAEHVDVFLYQIGSGPTSFISEFNALAVVLVSMAAIGCIVWYFIRVRSSGRDETR